MPDDKIKVPEQPQFDSPLKGMKWDEMSMVQKIQAKLSQGKDAERFQKMEAQAATKDMTKQAEPSTNMGGIGQLEKREPEEIVLNGLHYSTSYIMNHLGLKKDERKQKEDDPMSVYDSSLLAGPSIKEKVHNHSKAKTKSASVEETSNSGEAKSLDFAARNIDGMKQHMQAMNIGKRLPGKSHDSKKEAFSDTKDEIKVAYFLAGLLKTAGDNLPDFEKNPDLLVSFLTGLTKDAGIRDMIGSIGPSISRFLNRTTAAIPEAQQVLNPASTPWIQPQAGRPPAKPIPVESMQSAIEKHIGGEKPITPSGQRAVLQRTGPGV